MKYVQLQECEIEIRINGETTTLDIDDLVVLSRAGVLSELPEVMNSGYGSRTGVLQVVEWAERHGVLVDVEVRDKSGRGSEVRIRSGQTD
jgi:hypothetical protein